MKIKTHNIYNTEQKRKCKININRYSSFFCASRYGEEGLTCFFRPPLGRCLNKLLSLVRLIKVCWTCWRENEQWLDWSFTANGKSGLYQMIPSRSVSLQKQFVRKFCVESFWNYLLDVTQLSFWENWEMSGIFKFKF